MKTYVLAALLYAASLSFPCHAQQTMFGRNLVENADAESGIGSPQCDTVRTPGWTTVGEFTVGTYGGRSDVLTDDSPGPPLTGQTSRGKNFFCGGNGPVSQAAQTIDVSSAASIIDSGNATFEFSGWLGGDGASDDNSTLKVTFNDLRGSAIVTDKLGPVKASDRSSVKSLIFKQRSGVIPPSTRSITVGLDMQRVDGKLNDAYADNISFVMQPPINQNISSTSSSTGSSNSGSNSSSNPSSNTNTLASGISTSVNTNSQSGSTGSSSNNSSSSSNNAGGFAAGLGRFLGGFSAALNNGGGGSNFNNGGSSGFNGGLQNNSALSGIVHDRGKTIVTLDSDKMFPQGKWALNPGSDQVLEQIRRSEFASHQRRPIFFEGHTDEMADNLDGLALSMMRSLAIADWMSKHGEPSSQFEVRGCGRSLPKTVNINGTTRSQNRRVEIVLID